MFNKNITFNQTVNPAWLLPYAAIPAAAGHHFDPAADVINPTKNSSASVSRFLYWLCAATNNKGFRGHFCDNTR